MARGTSVQNLTSERSLGRRLLALLAVAPLLTSAAAAQAQTSWPQVSIPKGVTPADQDEKITADGLPIRMRAFTSIAKPAEVAELFRRSLGLPLVEDRVGARLVLGRSNGEHYVTVQLEAAGNGTRGLIAVTELTAALNGSAASRIADQRLLAKLPAGFSIVSRTSSSDAKNRVEHVVLTNSHSIALNTETVKTMLGADCYTFERETHARAQSAPNSGAASRDARMLFFRSPGAEAVAVISRDESGKSAVVLNTTSHLEHAK